MNESNATADNNSSSSLFYSFHPNTFEWLLLVVSFVIFVTGLVGNLLVIAVVAKNAHMRNLTNIFFLNLAVGDFLVILICLPPSVITDIAGTWWFGETMCKIIPYVQVLTFLFLRRIIMRKNALKLSIMIHISFFYI